MSKPLVFREEGWELDVTKDYLNLKSDEERRLMLLNDGFDEAHRSEAKRLFPEQFQGALECGEPKQEAPQPQPSVDCESRSRKPLKVGKLGKWLVGAIGLLGVIIGILANWNEALEKLRELLLALFP